MMVDFNPSAEGFVDLFGPSGPSGVYLLLRGAEVLYVGQSENVLQRVASHRRAQLRKGGRNGVEPMSLSRGMI